MTRSGLLCTVSVDVGWLGISRCLAGLPHIWSGRGNGVHTVPWLTWPRQGFESPAQHGRRWVWLETMREVHRRTTKTEERALIRAVVAVALSAVLAATPQSCEEKKKDARKPGGALPPTIVVSVSVSSTVAGFDWSINIPGSRGKPRFWSGHEKTYDHNERFEVVAGKDSSVTLTAGGQLSHSYTCEMRVRGGLIKDNDTAFGQVQCFQTVTQLLTP